MSWLNLIWREVSTVPIGASWVRRREAPTHLFSITPTSTEVKKDNGAPRTAFRSCWWRLVPDIGMIMIIIHLKDAVSHTS